MDNNNMLERLIKLEESDKNNTKKIEDIEKKQTTIEHVVNSLDKSLTLAVEQIKNIAEDLRITSVNFKEAVMRSNTANSKETEILKEKYNQLERKYEKLDAKLEQETVLKDAQSWRNSKKQIFAWVLAGVLAIVAGALGISEFF